jgi:hypothetical protein
MIMAHVLKIPKFFFIFWCRRLFVNLCPCLFVYLGVELCMWTEGSSELLCSWSLAWFPFVAVINKYGSLVVVIKYIFRWNMLTTLNFDIEHGHVMIIALDQIHVTVLVQYSRSVLTCQLSSEELVWQLLINDEWYQISSENSVWHVSMFWSIVGDISLALKNLGGMSWSICVHRCCFSVLIYNQSKLNQML